MGFSWLGGFGRRREISYPSVLTPVWIIRLTLLIAPLMSKIAPYFVQPSC